MRGKCFRCGQAFRFPYYAKSKFKICRKCGGRIQIKYFNQGEHYLEKTTKEGYKK